MFRKLILSTIALAAMTLGVLAPAVSAQTPTPFVCTGSYAKCLLDYPDGGFTVPGAATPTPKPTSSTVASADNVTATGDNGAIAFTGSESSVLGYTGAGLIGLGAIALVVARRKSDADTDLD